ncbi:MULTISPECIES: helix-turn-helix domain-containing protein [Rhizobium/Agrobacterium group]|uniref:winged helix-turn-helix transcriptional regulator n=1 Tax=Rhizobium/Agrobacterium group TaxID=227290 RepID=UPI001ADB732B|nr:MULTISPECIES: helix-turn-helix domain-containing protein [Rhizobium/Agrobacterium group]MBO9112487.1 helix-turn-helix transcriptional regulator [Agrobacterium sp. S2/73]QXZ75994.1 helix-turn-helix transcriptional regulator [Agrobacterium sp. S7/73]QYA16995.1 helix-turn-helix transcriptional regulator [Rhizobium sp. AB2/73]UEQ85432.1 helix-turn-helix transcriptional regulator [Rhizobium sp. AB2/73]
MEKTPAPELIAGVRRFVEMVDGPWAALILAQLCSGGRRRFSELREALPGISPHTLTRRLRQFEEAGIVSRVYYAEMPPRVEYELTPLGRTMRPVLERMSDWGLDAANATQPTKP